MNKILRGYKNFVMSNGKVNTVKKTDENDLKDIDELKKTLVIESIYSIIAYDDYINLLCNTFKIECCFTCGRYVFLNDLDCCEGCNEYICNSCKEFGCMCGNEKFDEFDDLKGGV